MRYTSLVLAASIAASPALAAVGVADFPGCATECAIFSTDGTDCSIRDFDCICTSKQYVDQVRSCLLNPPSKIKTKCSIDDIKKSLSVSDQLCKQAGYDLKSLGIEDPLPTSGGGADSSATSSGTVSSAAATDASTTGSASASASATDGSSSGTASATDADASSTDASATSSDAPEATDSEASEGGADMKKVGMGFVALAGLAAAAL